MAGILILAHGSRRPEAEAAFQKITAKLEAQLQQQGLAVEALAYTFLGCAAPSFRESLCSFAERGIKEIKVLPYFLFEGKHTVEDIPAIITQFCKDFPQVQVHLATVLGEDERLVQILADKVRELL